MADNGTLHDAFLDELRDAYDAEKQLTKALPKLAKAATSPELREAFESHLEETRGHVERLEQVFASLDEKVRGKHCDGIAGIIEEGKSVMEEDFDEATMDACLIAAGQRAEHYEMAAYGTLVAWARGDGPQRGREAAAAEPRRREGGRREADGARGRRHQPGGRGRGAPGRRGRGRRRGRIRARRTRRIGNGRRQASGPPIEHGTGSFWRHWRARRAEPSGSRRLSHAAVREQLVIARSSPLPVLEEQASRQKAERHPVATVAESE